MKKKAKKSGASKKAIKKAAKKSPRGKNLDPVKVRQDIAGMVKAGARGITRAVMV
jgi:hypothetical protein